MTNRADLVALVAQDLGLSTQDADKAVASVATGLVSLLASSGEAVLPKVGRFRVVERAGRQGRNPRTGEALFISPRTAVKFKTFPSFELPAAAPAPVAESGAPEA